MDHQFTATTSGSLAGVWWITPTNALCTWAYLIADQMLHVTRGVVTYRERFPKDDRLMSMQQLNYELPARARAVAHTIEQPTRPQR